MPVCTFELVSESGIYKYLKEVYVYIWIRNKECT